MDQARCSPWNPDRRWADPLIILLLLAALLSIWGFSGGPKAARPEPRRPGLHARAQELGRAALILAHAPMTARPLEATAGGHFWDRALLAIIAAEGGDLSLGRRLNQNGQDASTPLAQAFRQCWEAAYEEGPSPRDHAIDRLQEPLGDGFAYWSLRARLAEVASQPSEAYRARARAWALPRLAALGVGVLAAFALGLVGLVAAAVFVFTKRGPHPPAPLPGLAMPWRALVLALLGWFVALRCSGLVAAMLLSVLPLPRILALPLGYGFHVWVGVTLLLKAEGITLRTAWQRCTPGPLPRALGWALPFLGIAIASVVVVGLLVSPLVRGSEPPQRELMEMLASLKDPITTLILLLTIGGLAPLFEEWLFRSILLPWLGTRLTTRLGAHRGWQLAILLSGLAFGAMHLQPTGLATLATLGLVLGWAFHRTGSLWTSIAIHACWNVSVFLLVRVLA